MNYKEANALSRLMLGSSRAFGRAAGQVTDRFTRPVTKALERSQIPFEMTGAPAVQMNGPQRMFRQLFRREHPGTGPAQQFRFSPSQNIHGVESPLIGPDGLPSAAQSMSIKNSHIMNNTTALALAIELSSTMRKQACEQEIKQGSALLQRLVAKATPYVNKGLSAVGSKAQALPKGILANTLLGPEAESYYKTVAPALAAGKQVAKRVGTGVGIGTAGVLGAEAPFKAHNNEQYEQQQANPIRSWLGQHLLGQKKLQHQSYLNPFAI